MEARPVIIIGSGLWGQLLFYRLNSKFPDKNFLLYETEEEIESEVWTFKKKDLDTESWIKPLITQEWKEKRVEIKWPRFFRYDFRTPFYQVRGAVLNSFVRSQTRPEQWIKSPSLDFEDLLSKSSFIIDTRRPCPGNLIGYIPRIINLSSAFNRSSKHELVDAVNLINKMTETNFRLGNIRETVSEYK